MRSLLAGNGVIIQYGGLDYLNSNIIKRAISNTKAGCFPQNLYPKECADIVEYLHTQHTAILRGEYDQYVAASFERSSLEDFKRRYSVNRTYSVEQIGFEDYFLMFELVYNKHGRENPNRYNERGVLERMFLDAVYNHGRIESVHEKFSPGFVAFLREHDHIFTTNYDSNLEEASRKDVHHLHGAFRILSEVYDRNSFRNQLPEDILEREVVDTDYMYLYSNCLVSYVGDLKFYSMNQQGMANRAVEKFAKGYREDPAIRKEIDRWSDVNLLMRRLKEAIRLKAQRPDFEFAEQYPHGKLGEIDGLLEVVGLSPNNDSHLFARILENDRISEIRYNCFDHQEAQDAMRLFCSKRVVTKDVRELWKELDRR